MAEREGFYLASQREEDGKLRLEEAAEILQHYIVMIKASLGLTYLKASKGYGAGI